MIAGFGSAFAVPCVSRVAFMESIVTDTRSAQGPCNKARIFKGADDTLQITGLAQAKFAARDGQYVPSAAATYKLYVLKDSASPKDCKAGVAASKLCKPDVPTSTDVALAQIEGWEAAVCPTSATVSTDDSPKFNGRYTESASIDAGERGFRWYTGALQYKRAAASYRPLTP